MAALQDVYIFQTINHEHTKYGRGKKFSDVLYVCRFFFVFAEYDKRKKTGEHRTGNAKPGSLKFIEHGNPVKQVSCLDQDSHDKYRNRGKWRKEYLHGDKFE